MSNLESKINSVLEKYIIYIYEDYNHLIYLYEMERDEDKNPTFDYDYVINAIEHSNINLEKLNEIFTEYFDEQTGKKLIYDNFENQYRGDGLNDAEIQELLDDLTYDLNDLYDLFNCQIFYQYRDYIHEIIDLINNPPILK